MCALPREWRIDSFAIPPRPAPDDGEIFFLQLLLLHQESKPARGGRGFRDEDETARFAVQPVNDRDLATICDLEGEEVPEFAPQGAGTVRLRGMNEQERRFVDDDVFVGLIDNGEIGAAICATGIAGG